MASDKLLIQKKVSAGQRILPRNNLGVPSAVAMNDFSKGDIGILNYDTIYPVVFKERLLLLPGLELHCRKETKKLKKGSKNEASKQTKTKRKKTARKPNKGTSK